MLTKWKLMEKHRESYLKLGKKCGKNRTTIGTSAILIGDQRSDQWSVTQKSEDGVEV